MKERINDLLVQMTEIQSGKPWIGSSFSKKLRLVSDEDFYKRPIRNMHSCAEIISHLTTWRKETLLKLETGKGHLTDDHPSNWKDPDELKSQGRSKIMEEYEKSLSEILSFLEGKSDDFLQKTYYDGDFKGEFTYAWLLQGMMHHDIYHLGQIGYIVKFLKYSEH
jgi:uncharacterized damage-inducible protein DinB